MNNNLISRLSQSITFVGILTCIAIITYSIMLPQGQKYHDFFDNKVYAIGILIISLLATFFFPIVQISNKKSYYIFAFSLLSVLLFRTITIKEKYDPDKDMGKSIYTYEIDELPVGKYIGQNSSEKDINFEMYYAKSYAIISIFNNAGNPFVDKSMYCIQGNKLYSTSLLGINNCKGWDCPEHLKKQFQAQIYINPDKKSGYLRMEGDNGRFEFNY